MKFLVLGDCHGDLNSVIHAFSQAQKNDCEAVVQVGDFGFGWDLDKPEDRRFPASVNRVAEGSDIPLYWLDGNHENFDALELVVDVNADSAQKMYSHLYYLPRASTWTWGGLKMMALGGAYSIDKDRRVLGRSYWTQEMITYPQVEKARSRGKVDILFTHDAPEGVCPVVGDLGSSGYGYKNDVSSRSNRMALEAVIETAQPSLLVHGHMHHRYRVKRDNLTVLGLGRDGDRESQWAVIDTNDW